MDDHPLRPAYEAINSSIGRAVSYIGLWFLGTVIGNYVDYGLSFLGEGAVPRLDDELNGGVLALLLIAHPIGWLILISNVTAFPVFVRFQTSLWLLLLPFMTSLSYSLWLLNEFQ